jgi:diguanylate cyclase (GGDEF)-like protein
MTGFAPLRDAAGHQIGVLGVDVDARDFLARQATSRNGALLGLAPAGVLITVLGFLFYRVRRRGLADAQLALERAAQARATAEALAEERRRLSEEDRLTGLPNRAVFMEHLERSLSRVRSRQQDGCAVLFFDFDRFKLVNDTLGHEAGDELLRQIGRRLQTALRLGTFSATDVDSDVISRFGGDEFLVLINQIHQVGEAVKVAERLLNALAPSYGVLGHEVHSMASVGIVTSFQCSGGAEEIVRNADVAMYEAKHSGRGCSVVFSEAMHARLTRHLAIETSLRRALGTPQLCLKYQPVVDLNTGSRCGLEVSVCWNHPSLGSVAPQEFVPIAEDSGLLVAIWQWVLEEACQQMVKWRQSGAAWIPDTVSICVANSAIAFSERVLDHVRRTLQASGLTPGCLQLEVSERAFQQNPGHVDKLFRGLHELGVKFAMNGFGAGHSSLSMLRSQPFDAVKLDRSFLQDLGGSHGSLAVVGATLNLIRNLGLRSIAEGVDDHTHIAILQSLGCHAAQGGVFGGPMLAAEVDGTVLID